MHSLPSPKPTISYLDDLDFFKEFENEFPAIVYNDAQTSKLDLLTELILSPQHIDEFDLNDETSLFEYKEEEQNVLYFNDLFPFNIIHSDDLKSEEDNDDNDIDIIQSSEDMALLPHDQRHPYLRREVHKVQVFNFGGLPDLMAKGLSARMLMEHRDAQGAILDLHTLGALQFQLGESRRHMSWRQFILALGLHTDEEMQAARFDAYWADSARQIPDKEDLRDYWIEISSTGYFLGTTLSNTTI
ncbi:hypothetical protein Tco_0850334 [Tanacetum coccineum]